MVTRLLRIDLADFRQRFGMDAFDLDGREITELMNHGLVETEGDELVVTRRGAAIILDVGWAFYTENNMGRLHPQYYILGFLDDSTVEASKSLAQG